MANKEDKEAYVPNLGNYAEYSSRLKALFQSAGGMSEILYERLKAAILAGEITVNTLYLPGNYRVFSIVFYNKDISETVVTDVVGEEVAIVDPLVEHRNDILKAIESSVRFDVYLKDKNGRIFTLDMQRAYVKKRNRNRGVYYGAKEIAAQEVKDGKYEKLKSVFITFIFEKNTTPGVPALACIQLTDVMTKKIYTDLFTLYEFNLNAELGNEDLPENLVILRSYLSIKSHEDLRSFVETYDSQFSRRLITEYMRAILNDELLLKVEGSEKYMVKLSEDLLLEERLAGREEERDYWQAEQERWQAERRALERNLVERDAKIAELLAQLNARQTDPEAPPYSG